MASPSESATTASSAAKQAAEDDGYGPRAPHEWMILGVVSLAQLMVVLDATVVTIALPSAQRDLGFNNGSRQWIVTAYALAFGSLLLVGGRFADLFGRRTALVGGLVGFAVASALAGIAPNVGVLIGGRALQGLFGALLAPAALSALTTTFTRPAERNRAFAVYGAVAGAGGAIGLLLGGLLTEYLNWRWTLFINLVIAAVALVGALAYVPNHRPAGRPTLDIPGTVLACSGLFLLVFGFSRAEEKGWSSPQSWVSLLLGGILLITFAWWQTRAPHPLLPLRVPGERNRGASYLGMFVTGAGMFGVFLFLTYYLQVILGYSPVKTGLAFLPMIATLMVAAQIATIGLLPRIGPRPLVPVGMLCGLIGMLWLTRLDLHSSYAPHVLPPLLVLGFGMGLIFAPAMAMATYGVRPDDAGVASAMVNTCQQVGGSIGTALLSTLAATAAANYAKGKTPSALVTAQANLHSYATAYRWSAAFFAVGMVVCFLLYRSGAPKTDPEEQGGGAVHM
ncbi:MFS transporter [Catenulispora sp. NF23]|uniref:MFS transporter n=1 Tax=Catenulispora pinistramenti TaxID=2705254 RepID=UPI001BABB295|nr:MFS transporter [Catenulispora pinistramenti]MBS2531827.1 MFS transporter [Catenulispora pinistramenti]